ncbi:MAG: hypothetical protein HON04_17955 [Planctomicrobium sp.]|jgi:hypothetical protein|nr:hypothetical protein [Planctomicrobium sp.]
MNLLLMLIICCMAGCGTTKSTVATEQILLSDAVDHAVARIDFTPMADQKVFFDTEFIKNYKGIGFVNSEYVISSLRQQMSAAGLHLQEKQDTADFILEGRIGALGTDAHEVVYGIPSTSALNDAADAVAAFSSVPKVPGIPELALAKRSNQIAAAKVAIFAYENESRQRVWQSGMSTGKSTAKDLWIFGAGPFQKGTIHQGNVRFAGSSLDVPLLEDDRKGSHGPIASYRNATIFEPQLLDAEEVATEIAETEAEKSDIQQASAEEIVKEEKK